MNDTERTRELVGQAHAHVKAARYYAEHLANFKGAASTSWSAAAAAENAEKAINALWELIDVLPEVTLNDYRETLEEIQGIVEHYLETGKVRRGLPGLTLRLYNAAEYLRGAYDVLGAV